MNTLDDYITRLKRCGLSATDATVIAQDMHKNFGWNGLEDYTSSLEAENHVERIQS